MNRYSKFIFLSFYMLSELLHAQDSMSVKNSITINTGQIFIGEVQLLYERRWQSIGIEFGLGYKIPSNATIVKEDKEYIGGADYYRMPFIGFSEGYFASFSSKKYLACTKKIYLSLGAFYRNWNYQNKIIESSTGLSRDPANYTVKGSTNINVWGMKALIGSQLNQKNNSKFILDGFIGLGLRYKMVDMHNEYYHRTTSGGTNIDVPYEFKKDVWRPSIQAGLKMGIGW
jgi:hypothetical protein